MKLKKVKFGLTDHRVSELCRSTKPLRTSAAEHSLIDTFTAAGEPVPNFDALPWGQRSRALTGAAFGASWNYMGPRREGDPLRWSEKWDRFDIFAPYRRRFGDYPVSFAFNVKNLLDRTFRVDRDTFATGREFRFSVTFTLK